MRPKPKKFIVACFFLWFAVIVAAADNTKTLIGSWSGRATGPQGGPPTGDITLTMEKAGGVLGGIITVKAPGGAQYSGQVSKIALSKGIFAATATFKLGENPLIVAVSGPLKGTAIDGTFVVSSKERKMGDGTFSIRKSIGAKPAKQTH